MASSNDILLMAGQKHTVAQLPFSFLKRMTHTLFRSCLLDKGAHAGVTAQFWLRSEARMTIEDEVGGGNGGI